MRVDLHQQVWTEPLLDSLQARASATRTCAAATERLVYGSDRPVIDPVPTGREAALMHDAARLVQSAGAPA